MISAEQADGFGLRRIRLESRRVAVGEIPNRPGAHFLESAPQFIRIIRDKPQVRYQITRNRDPGNKQAEEIVDPERPHITLLRIEYWQTAQMMGDERRSRD